MEEKKIQLKLASIHDKNSQPTKNIRELAQCDKGHLQKTYS